MSLRASGRFPSIFRMFHGDDLRTGPASYCIPRLALGSSKHTAPIRPVDGSAEQLDEMGFSRYRSIAWAASQSLAHETGGDFRALQPERDKVMSSMPSRDRGMLTIPRRRSPEACNALLVST